MHYSLDFAVNKTIAPSTLMNDGGNIIYTAVRVLNENNEIILDIEVFENNDKRHPRFAVRRKRRLSESDRNTVVSTICSRILLTRDICSLFKSGYGYALKILITQIIVTLMIAKLLSIINNCVINMYII